MAKLAAKRKCSLMKRCRCRQVSGLMWHLPDQKVHQSGHDKQPSVRILWPGWPAGVRSIAATTRRGNVTPLISRLLLGLTRVHTKLNWSRNSKWHGRRGTPRRRHLEEVRPDGRGILTVSRRGAPSRWISMSTCPVFTAATQATHGSYYSSSLTSDKLIPPL